MQTEWTFEQKVKVIDALRDVQLVKATKRWQNGLCTAKQCAEQIKSLQQAHTTLLAELEKNKVTPC